MRETTTGYIKMERGCIHERDGGPTGIRGVLRDELGNIKAMFFGLINAQDINVAELLAISQALILSKSDEEVWCYTMVIESDSVNATCWSNRKEGGGWGAQLLLNRIWGASRGVREDQYHPT